MTSPYWELERPYELWVISSQTRRSIPPVCQQWFLVGLEFLYKHIVIGAPSQLFKVLNVFQEPEHGAHLHAKYVGWVRGVEFIILRNGVHFEIEFTLGACDLYTRYLVGAYGYLDSRMDNAMGGTAAMSLE